jgi:hypothetical protein
LVALSAKHAFPAIFNLRGPRSVSMTERILARPDTSTLIVGYRAEGMNFVLRDPIFFAHRAILLKLASAVRLPTIHELGCNDEDPTGAGR